MGALPHPVLRATGTLAACAWLACSASPGSPGSFEPLVFPGEAELGATAAVVVDSNYIPDADVFERYDLYLERVGIEVRDSQGTPRAATMRGVFPLEASPISKLADARPGAHVTVALFDLPTNAPPFVYDGTPYTAEVLIRIDGLLITNPSGSIRITGAGGPGVGGQPLEIAFPSIPSLEPQERTARMRAVREQAPEAGFPVGATIAALEFTANFIPFCVKDPKVYPAAEASGANVFVGPTVAEGWTSRAKVVLSDPDGFTLAAPSGGASWALGEGPLFDVTFTKVVSALYCSAIPLFIEDLYAVAPDGSTVVDERGFDSSDYFEMYEIMR